MYARNNSRIPNELHHDYETQPTPHPHSAGFYKEKKRPARGANVSPSLQLFTLVITTTGQDWRTITPNIQLYLPLKKNLPIIPVRSDTKVYSRIKHSIIIQFIYTFLFEPMIMYRVMGI